MLSNVQPSPKAKLIPNWEAHVRRLVEGLKEGEVSIDVVDHQVTKIEVEEVTCLLSEPPSVVSASNRDAQIDAPATTSQRAKR